MTLYIINNFIRFQLYSLLIYCVCHISTYILISLSLFLVVNVVHEWHDVLVPSWDVALSLLSDQVGQQSHVLDLLLLQLDVGVETANVELLLESHGEAFDGLFEHDLIYKIFKLDSNGKGC